MTVALSGRIGETKIAAASTTREKGGFETRPYGTTRWHCLLSW